MLTSLLLYSLLSLTGIFDLHFTDINGNQINLADYQGKKILFVNTASGSEFTPQYAGLEELSQQYKDSLVIIAFPSNNFNNELGTNEEIKDFVSTNYNAHFIVASKIDVIGENQDSIYQWLTRVVQNGVMDTDITNDFFKILINGKGNLIGVFDSSVDPMSNTIKEAIE